MEVLRGVDESASVTASTFYTTALSGREVLYDLGYASEQHLFSSDVVVLDPRYASECKRWATDAGKTNGLDNLRRKLEKKGYVLEAEYGGRVEVYRKAG